MEKSQSKAMLKRRITPTVQVGHIPIGSNHPIAIQSMTNTATADIEATLHQIIELVGAGSELVRITVNDDTAARSAIEICKRLIDLGHTAPIIGDFHFNGHTLLTRYPALAECLAKYRINPGNIGSAQKHDEHFATFIKIALEYSKPVRIGVNGGSLDQDLLTRMMDINAKKPHPDSPEKIFCEAVIESALQSVEQANALGLPDERIILSAKLSDLNQLLYVNQELARRCSLALHLGLTEAGLRTEGTVKSSVALGILLNQGIGDTIRVSLTPDPQTPRTQEIEICKNILQSLGLRLFSPTITSCPGCGRTDNTLYQQLALDIHQYILQNLEEWKKKYQGIESLRIAVMGCVVNGPGESRDADIGISLPGQSEQMQAPVFIEGKQTCILKEPSIKADFLKILDTYIAKRFQS